MNAVELNGHYGVGRTLSQHVVTMLVIFSAVQLIAAARIASRLLCRRRLSQRQHRQWLCQRQRRLWRRKKAGAFGLPLQCLVGLGTPTGSSSCHPALNLGTVALSLTADMRMSP